MRNFPDYHGQAPEEDRGAGLAFPAVLPWYPRYPQRILQEVYVSRELRFTLAVWYRTRRLGLWAKPVPD